MLKLRILTLLKCRLPSSLAGIWSRTNLGVFFCFFFLAAAAAAATFHTQSKLDLFSFSLIPAVWRRDGIIEVNTRPLSFNPRKFNCLIMCDLTPEYHLLSQPLQASSRPRLNTLFVPNGNGGSGGAAAVHKSNQRVWFNKNLSPLNASRRPHWRKGDPRHISSFPAAPPPQTPPPYNLSTTQDSRRRGATLKMALLLERTEEWE